MTTLWRINISPAAQEDVDPREFCFRRGLVGFGWPVDVKASSISWSHYKRLGTNRYYQKGDRGWRPAVNALYDRMAVGDLVWSRNWDNVYFLGRVAGEWEYSNDEEHRRADIVNFRSCEWFEAGVADKAPGAVRNSFSRGRTLQAVDDSSSLAYSQRLFNRLAGRSQYEASKESLESNLFSLISPTALEDLVGLYLQSRGYSVVPSSCRRTSAKYEFVLKHRRSGGTATVQVKAGSQALDRDEFARLPGEVFIFAASENYTGKNYSNVYCLYRRQLERFAKRNARLLPETIANWIPLPR